MPEQEKTEKTEQSKAEAPSDSKPKPGSVRPKRGRPSRGRQNNKAKVSESISVNKEKPKEIVLVEPSTSFIKNLKGNRPIIGLTAYDTIMGSAVSAANVDFILVGDSLGTTLLGYDTTIPVTMDDMVRHTSAVRRANPQCLVVADLPFGEASLSFDRLLESCRRLMQEGGADAVKIEGGKDVADDIEKLVATGIPVLGHIGLLPQYILNVWDDWPLSGGQRQKAKMKQRIFRPMRALLVRCNVWPPPATGLHAGEGSTRS